MLAFSESENEEPPVYLSIQTCSTTASKSVPIEVLLGGKVWQKLEYRSDSGDNFRSNLGHCRDQVKIVIRIRPGVVGGATVSIRDVIVKYEYEETTLKIVGRADIKKTESYDVRCSKPEECSAFRWKTGSDRKSMVWKRL